MTISLSMVRPAAPGNEYSGPADQVGLDALLNDAREQVMVMSTLSAANATFRRFDPKHLRRGVRYRMIFPDTARTLPTLCTYLAGLSLAGTEIRTAGELPMDTLIVDRRLAVLPADRPGGSFAVLDLASVVATSVELFDRIWRSAAPLTASDLPAGADLTPRERELLSQLSHGATDDSAAAQLGVSVRTVRRMVADIMNRLGARSRFQAGVKAADRGWLIEKAG